MQIATLDNEGEAQEELNLAGMHSKSTYEKDPDYTPDGFWNEIPESAEFEFNYAK